MPFHRRELILSISCSRFRASLIYINNCPTRCNTNQSIYYSASLLIWPRWRKVAAQNIWPVPGAIVTVLCTPDDGCGWHPIHVEWTCRILNRLLCVAFRWMIINITMSNYFKTCTVHLFSFCTMTNQCTINWQITILLLCFDITVSSSGSSQLVLC